MKVVLSGPVTAEILDRADMLGGITIREAIVSDKQQPPPAELNLTVTCIPLSAMLGDELSVLQNDWRLVMAADAVVIVGDNPHLARCANIYQLPCYVE